MTKIEMLDLDGRVTETCEACEVTEVPGAVCEDGEGLQEHARCAGEVWRWTTADGMTFEACTAHIEADDFSRFAA